MEDGWLRVKDFTGEENFRREVDVLGVGGDAVACARFDTAFLKALEERGIRTAYALKQGSGLGYDTAAKVLASPHENVSRRVFLVVCGNLDLDLAGIEEHATYDADADAFGRAYGLAQSQVLQLLGGFLRLDARMQNSLVKQVRAAGGGRVPYSDNGAHEAACRRLSEQLLGLVSLRPNGMIEVVDDEDAPDGKPQDAVWSGKEVRWG